MKTLNANIADILDRQSPEKECFIYKAEKRSYVKLKSAVQRLAQFLSDKGVRQGHWC